MAELNKGAPEVGLRFKSADEAWQFWVAYGGHTGFDVRKRYTNVSTFDGKVTSCRFVCSNEGLPRKGQTNHVRKCFRAETRTDCKAQMSLMLDRGAGNYEVTEVMLEHNHLLHLPETRHLMASQRKISELQAFQSEYEWNWNLNLRQGKKYQEDKCTHLCCCKQAKCTLQLFFKLSEVNMKDPWLHVADY